MKKAVAVVAVAIVVAGCEARSQAPSLKESLAGVAGVYTAAATGYDYSAREELERILSTAEPRAIVPVLVDCLDNSAPSRSTLDGRPVSVGMVCYEALTQLVYYEPTAPSGDVALEWEGYVAPSASAQDLRAAKKAWMQMVEQDAYILQ
jgi:hypothetical protein